MSKVQKSKGWLFMLFGFLILSLLVGGIVFYLQGKNVSVLQPAGTIAQQQKDLITFAVILSVIVVVPVFLMTIIFAYKYRASSKNSKYTPDWDSSKKAETVMWGVPIILILVLAFTTWQTSHSLDPFKALASDQSPLRIQVIALQWRWLFIYPEERVATINYAKIPEDRPVKFEITSDAPMNSFWIPQLGGQIYAMEGMSTELNLQSDNVGVYDGRSANISGEGFSNMTFKVEATTKEEYRKWYVGLWSAEPLTNKLYEQLSEPSTETNPRNFLLANPKLYEDVVASFMSPSHKTESQNGVYE